MSRLALVSRIHQGSFITGRHQLDKRAIKTSGLFLYRSAPCRLTPSGSHKPLSSRSGSAKVSTRPRSALECRDKRGQVLSCQRHRPSWSSLTHPPSWLIQSQDKFDTTNPWSFLPPSVTYPAHPPVHFLSLPVPFFLLFIIFQLDTLSTNRRPTNNRLAHDQSLYLSVCF